MSNELTAAQAAEQLNVGRSTVSLWCRQGRFDGAHMVKSPVGDYWLIPAKAVKDFEPPKRGRIPKPKAEEPAKGNGAEGRKRAAKKGGKK